MAKTSRNTTILKEKFKELGLGSKRMSNDRLIDKDGRFNVVRKGAGIRGFSLYHLFIDLSWLQFFLLVTLGYCLINGVFASTYYLIGVDHLTEYNPQTMSAFWHCFYFSCQTLTTVGYGRISPIGPAVNFLAAFEAMIGLLSFAFATGILYGRFSKAKSKIIFSKNILVAPYQTGKGLKFRIANSRKNELIEMEARLMYSFLEESNGELKRRYMSLDLEISFINMFPLPWTIVHPIDENSPLLGKGVLDFSREKAEFLVILKGFDGTFNQYVHQVHDYNYTEVVFDSEFLPMFDPASETTTVVQLNQISDYRKV
jgi:inward rectifier potassium channel